MQLPNLSFAPDFCACILYFPQWVTFLELNICFCDGFFLYFSACVDLPMSPYYLGSIVSCADFVSIMVYLVGYLLSNLHGVLSLCSCLLAHKIHASSQPGINICRGCQ